MDLFWKKIKTDIKKKIPGHNYRMWIEPLEIYGSEENKIELSCPNSFFKKRVYDNYGALIKSTIDRISGQERDLSFVVSNGNGNPKKKSGRIDQMPLPSVNGHINRGRFLRKDFTFDQFVVSNNNDFAYSAALSLATGKLTQKSSLFLLSKTGMGKSHLSQAVGNHIMSKFPSERVFYITAKSFSNEMVEAIQHDTFDKFKKKYQNGCDVLLLDDIHYLSGKRTQIELALILDILMETGGKIIFSSSYLPADIPKLNDELGSRLISGLISTIEPPDFRTRVRILQKKSKANGYSIPDNVTQYLAGELLEDVRQLESGLIGVTAKSDLLGVPIDLELAESVVKNLVRKRKEISINVIKKMVCKEYNMTVKDLISQSRKRHIVHPRQIAIYLSRRFTDTSLQEIGRSFNRYHATALHSISSVERKMEEDTVMRKQVEILCKKLDTGKF